MYWITQGRNLINGLCEGIASGGRFMNPSTKLLVKIIPSRREITGLGPAKGCSYQRKALSSPFEGFNLSLNDGRFLLIVWLFEVC